jgi:hypothetical protein
MTLLTALAGGFLLAVFSDSLVEDHRRKLESKRDKERLDAQERCYRAVHERAERARAEMDEKRDAAIARQRAAREERV